MAALFAGALVLGACGGGDGSLPDEVSAEDLEDFEDLMEEAGAGDPSDAGADDRSADVGGDIEIIPPEFPLPAEASAPAGFEVVEPACVDSEWGAGAYSYAVPAGWEVVGRSGGGSGPLGNSTELTFKTPEGEELSIGVRPDSVEPDGTVMDEMGEPFESFDYEWSSYGSEGEQSGTITFDLVDTVDVGDQQVDVFVALQGQSEFVGATEHKARLQIAELPNPAVGDDDKIQPASMVVTITHDADALELSDDVVLDIIGSFALPECSTDQIITMLEIQLGEDVDGDGEVRTVEDMRL